MLSNHTFNQSFSKPSNTHCSRGHEYTDANLYSSNTPDKKRCRACTLAQQWANRHNLFYDDPLVLAYADAKFAERVDD